MFSYFRKMRAYKQTRRELSSLSHRELDDIGINSCDIKRLAQEAADAA